MPIPRLFSRLLRFTLTGFGLSLPLALSAERPLAPATTIKVVEGRESYESGGRTIRVDTFLPETTTQSTDGTKAGASANHKGHDKCPAVLVLYGSGGALMGKGEIEMGPE